MGEELGPFGGERLASPCSIRAFDQGCGRVSGQLGFSMDEIGVVEGLKAV